MLIHREQETELQPDLKKLLDAGLRRGSLRGRIGKEDVTTEVLLHVDTEVVGTRGCIVALIFDETSTTFSVIS